jgi:hypothetical protein
MSDSDTVFDAEDTVDEITLLKQRADTLGITYSPRIGVDSLRAKIDERLNEKEPDAPAGGSNKLSKVEQMAALRESMHKEQMKMVRLRITNLNPNKKELTGEIFTVANKFLGIVKKYIPYGEVTEDGYHVPYILYTELRDRKFLSIKTRQDKTTGQIVVSQNWVPEFALEVLPQLTQAELNKLAAAQSAAGGAS